MPVAPVLAADVAPALKKMETKPAEPKAPVSVQTGVASWYEGEGVGKRAGTLTAAHRKLPFGTLVRVTNLANNRSTVVKINDRGPFIKGRVIDVNATAARQLAMINSGVSRVRLEVLPREAKGEF